MLFVIPDCEYAGSQETEELIERTAKKDKRAFEELYKRTSRSVYAYALSILKNPYDAEDIMHESFLSIYSSAPSYCKRNKPMAWILTITKNYCLKKLKERKKSDEINENVVCSFDSFPMNAENRNIIEKCFSLLNDDEREIIILYCVAGFKHREIAEHMDILLSTELSKYNRAIKKLRKNIKIEG